MIGFHSLPLELVAYIFELSVIRKHYVHDSTRDLISVNSFFRNTALKIPTLWTSLDSSRDPSLAIQRSGSKGLAIYISTFLPQESVFKRFLPLLEPHIWRWQSFELSIDDAECVEQYESFESRLMDKLREDFKEKTFLGLERIKIIVRTGTDRDIGFFGEEYEDDSETGSPMPIYYQDRTLPAYSFFSEWDMPALRYLSVEGFIPIIPSTSTCRASLTRFEFILRAESTIDRYGWDMDMIEQAINSLSSLEELSLRFSYIRAWRNYEEARIELPNLRRLDFKLCSCEIEPALQLIDTISSPNIKDLNITLHDYDQGAVTEILAALFPVNKPRWLRLEALECHIVSMNYEDRSAISGDHHPLDMMCSRLPPLRHLFIHAIRIRPPRWFALHPFFCGPTYNPMHPPEPPLRTLRLQGCTHFVTMFISRIKNVIQAPEFERLEIAGCRNIDIGFVRDCMPIGKKLEYRPKSYIVPFDLTLDGSRY